MTSEHIREALPITTSDSSVAVVGNLVVTVAADGSISTRKLSYSLCTPIYNWLCGILDQLCQIEEEFGCVFASEFPFPIPLSTLSEISLNKLSPEEVVRKIQVQTSEILQEARVVSKCFSSSSYKLVAGRKAIREKRKIFKAVFSSSDETSHEQSVLSLLSAFEILSLTEN